ncbi:MAG: SDR family oxidoreductase [Streptomycetaceae bacterium]|jgi:NAD(P)-dependent dehydrogenase (short-subunit alcohol dehydrogenase family)|uniref:SDR family oxidoreductase n=1 Tax=Yinghuangia aomiensis TaxID=676205 RepID=A0ABP9HVW5_9ACTN|nr:SDR family oxidoreductase [Streptomycetaceae bacterium]
MTAPANPLDLTGKVVLVTGGAKGIGRGITERFLAAGADAVVCSRSEPESLPSAGGRTAVYHPADVRDPDTAFATVAFIEEKFGRLDVLVNNAGGAPFSDAATVSPRFSKAIIELNLLGPLYFAQAAFRLMNGQEEGGSIVNISSVSGVRPSPGTAAYGAAKAGMNSLTKTLAVEWGPKVRVNSIVVGLVKTEQAHLHYGDDAGIAAVGATIPLGRMAEPDDVADACLFLGSPMSRYVSGAEILLHGGGEKPAFLGAANSEPDHAPVN